MNRNVRLLLLVSVVLFGTMLSVQATRALTIVPPTLDYSLKRGDVVSGKVKLYNESTTEATTVFASTANFTAKGEGGEPDFDLTDTPTGAAAWVTSANGAITLKAGERLEVPFTITVPADAEPGGHYVSLFFGTDPSLQPQDGGQVTIKSLLGALIIMRVDGQIRENASIATFAVKDGATLTRLPATFTVRVQNSGNVHVRPQGTILIKNLMGGETSTLSINDANGAVLPNSVRAFDATWNKTTDPAAKMSFFKELAAQWHNFAIGPYTATVTLDYGTGNQPLVASAKVTIIPWQLLLLELVIVAIVILIIIFGMRAYNQTIIRRAQNLPPKSQG